METALSAIYPNTKVIEWWEYNGLPYHFRLSINVSSDETSSLKHQRVMARLELYKNLRSQLDEVEYYDGGAEITWYAGADMVGIDLCDGCTARSGEMANWEGIITDAGAQLLQALVDHTSLRITSAAAGAGSVDTGLLASQTALVSRKQPVSLIGSEPVEGGVRLKLRLTGSGNSLCPAADWRMGPTGRRRRKASGCLSKPQGIFYPGQINFSGFCVHLLRTHFLQ